MDQDPKRAGNTEEGGGGEAGTKATSREDAGSSQPGRQQSAKGGLWPTVGDPRKGTRRQGQPPRSPLALSSSLSIHQLQVSRRATHRL